MGGVNRRLKKVAGNVSVLPSPAGVKRCLGLAIFDAVVVGAGAAGLMCAYQAALRGRRILVVEASRKPGRKILMSGGGRCNFTNLDLSDEHYLCDNPHFVKSALARYTPWDFLDLVERHAIEWHERDHRQLFCTQSAKDILNMLLHECRQAGVEIWTECRLDRSDQLGDSWRLETTRGDVSTGSLVVATGGLSIPSMGADGWGYQLAESLELPLVGRRAGLVPFTCSGALKDLTASLSGNAIPVSGRVGNAEFTEAMLFTHRGLSGPSMLQLSSYWREGMSLELDIFAGRDMQAQLLLAREQHPKRSLLRELSHWLPKSVLLRCCEFCEIEGLERPLHSWPDKALQQLVHRLSHWRLKPAGTEGYRTAEVTLGGVDVRCLSSKTMATKQVPNLYFIGEVVDVTGHLGGFNFQWAWSSGWAAAQSV